MAAAKKESEEPRIVPVRGLDMFQHSQGWIMPSFVRHGISSLIFLGAHSFISGVWEHRRALPAGGTISPEACWANQKRIAAMAAGPILGNVLGAQLIRTSLEQGGRDPASLSTSFMTMGIVAAPQVAVAMAMRNKALNSEMLMAFAYGTLYSEIEAMRVRSNYTANRGRLPYF